MDSTDYCGFQPKIRYEYTYGKQCPLFYFHFSQKADELLCNTSNGILSEVRKLVKGSFLLNNKNYAFRFVMRFCAQCSWIIIMFKNCDVIMFKKGLLTLNWFSDLHVHMCAISTCVWVVSVLIFWPHVGSFLRQIMTNCSPLHPFDCQALGNKLQSTFS